MGYQFPCGFSVAIEMSGSFPNSGWDAEVAETQRKMTVSSDRKVSMLRKITMSMPKSESKGSHLSALAEDKPSLGKFCNDSRSSEMDDLIPTNLQLALQIEVCHKYLSASAKCKVQHNYFVFHTL